MIQLRKVSRQPNDISIFANHEAALEHICDHVLTREESYFWVILIPRYRDIVNPTNDRELDILASAFWRDQEQDLLQELYEGYAKVIADELHFSYHDSWYWEQDHYGKSRYFGIGLHGVYVIWSLPTVVSAMLLPYAAKKTKTSFSCHDRLTTPRPRRPGSEFSNEIRSDTEENRYEIFFAGCQSVRREYMDACADKKKKVVRKCPEIAKDKVIPVEDWKKRVFANRSER